MNPTLNPLTPSHPPNSRHSFETFGTHSILHPLGLLQLFFFLSPRITLLSAFSPNAVSNGLVLTLHASLCKISASDLKKWKQIDRAGHTNSKAQDASQAWSPGRRRRRRRRRRGRRRRRRRRRAVCITEGLKQRKKARERERAFQLTFSADSNSVQCLLFVPVNLYVSHSMLSTVSVI